MPKSSVKINLISIGPDIFTFTDVDGKEHQGVVLEMDKAGVPTLVGPAEPLPVLEWIQAVREGLITGYATVNVQGHATAMGNTFQTAWDDVSLVNVGLMAAPSTVKVASTDVDDTLVGTGARTLRIIGLDAAGVAQQVDVNLSGQAEVATTETWSAINFLQVLTVGATRSNEGAIWCGNGTFTLGVPSTKYHLMEASFTISKTGIYTVPTGKTAFLWSAIFMIGDTTKTADVHMHADDGVIDRVVAPFELGSGTLTTRAPGAAPFLAGQTLKIEGKVDTGNASFATLLVLILKDTP